MMHTSHPTYAYLIRADRHRTIWAPEIRGVSSYERVARISCSSTAPVRPIQFTVALVGISTCTATGGPRTPVDGMSGP
jgi:hypothetical protein